MADEVRSVGRRRATGALILLTLCPLLASCWRVSSGISSPRYAPDGRGIYYEREYCVGESEYEYDLLHQSSIDAKPVRVHGGDDVPPEVGELHYHLDPAFYPVADGWGSRNGLRLETTESSSRDLKPKLFVIDEKTKKRKVLTPWGPGDLSTVHWVDDTTVFAGVSLLKDDSARVDLLDIKTGKLTNVLKVPGAKEGPAVMDGEFIWDPEGFFVFTVDPNGDDADGSDLYRFDLCDADAVRIGRVVCSFEGWDYSPTKNTVLECKSGTYDRVFERPLPTP